LCFQVSSIFDLKSANTTTLRHIPYACSLFATKLIFNFDREMKVNKLLTNAINLMQAQDEDNDSVNQINVYKKAPSANEPS
jgi:hypothetical protein